MGVALPMTNSTEPLTDVIAVVEAGAKGTRRGMVILAVFLIGLGVLGMALLDSSDTGSRLARRAIFGAYALPQLRALGWRVRVSLKEGIGNTYPWVDEQVQAASS